MSEKDLKVLIELAFKAHSEWADAISNYENATDPFTKLVYATNIMLSYNAYKRSREMAFLGVNTLN